MAENLLIIPKNSNFVNKLNISMKAMILISIIVSIGTWSCGNTAKKANESQQETVERTDSLVKKPIKYTAAGDTMQGYLAYHNNTANTKKPGVLVVHEWWGLDDYTRHRVEQLADLGYVALAVDMYGHGKTAANPTEAMALAGPNYQNPQLAKERFDAALAQLKSLPEVDSTKIAAIGYCFGGSMVLNAAKLGDKLQAVVSFHGGLKGVPAKKELLSAPILICHGAADKNIPEADVQQFRKELDAIGANYTFKAYPGATHAFTNPAATATGKKFNLPISYNAAADTASWNDMKAFFATYLEYRYNPG
ncbi:Dienelactone hydrolase [bacterium A37T11]|nr:Dienelactone hydrolase [bacterium A37T11]